MSAKVRVFGPTRVEQQDVFKVISLAEETPMRQGASNG